MGLESWYNVYNYFLLHFEMHFYRFFSPFLFPQFYCITIIGIQKATHN